MLLVPYELAREPELGRNYALVVPPDEGGTAVVRIGVRWVIVQGFGTGTLELHRTWDRWPA